MTQLLKEVDAVIENVQMPREVKRLLLELAAALEDAEQQQRNTQRAPSLNRQTKAEVQRRLLERIEAKPGIALADLIGTVGLPPSRTTAHIREMENAGLIYTVRGENRTKKHCYPMPRPE